MVGLEIPIFTLLNCVVCMYLLSGTLGASSGYFFMGHPEMMIRKQCEDMYTALLQPTSSVDLTLQVLLV